MVCIAMKGEIDFQMSNSVGFLVGFEKKQNGVNGNGGAGLLLHICKMEIYSFKGEIE